jgi:hypothetical protein
MQYPVFTFFFFFFAITPTSFLSPPVHLPMMTSSTSSSQARCNGFMVTRTSMKYQTSPPHNPLKTASHCVFCRLNEWAKAIWTSLRSERNVLNCKSSRCYMLHSFHLTPLQKARPRCLCWFRREAVFTPPRTAFCRCCSCSSRARSRQTETKVYCETQRSRCSTISSQCTGGPCCIQ